MIWSVGKLTLAMYPFGAGAMAVNSFFFSLIGSWFGFTVWSTSQSILAGAILGLPFTWLFARHIRNLAIKADAESG